MAFDLVGNIAILKFSDKDKITLAEKKERAKKILSENKNVKTVLEKTGMVKGRLRTQETKYLAGRKTKEAEYRENNCSFVFNVDTCYFSPRLANDRLEISKQVKANDKVLVMFSGVGPYPIVIAKLAKPKMIYSIELSRIANKYAKKNMKLNKISETKLKIIQGDVKKKIKELKNEKFDVIIMPRPQLKDTFLKEAFSASKKGTRIFYHGFVKIQDKDTLIKILNKEAKKNKKRLNILSMKQVGHLAPYKYRFRIDFKVLK